METSARIVFLIAAGGVASVLFGYPVLLWLRALGQARRSAPRDEHPDQRTLPTVTMLVAVRNGEELIGPKIENTLALDYPGDALDLIVASDGSTDRTVEIARALAAVQPRVTVLAEERHLGKARVLNTAASLAHGSILVLSDADASLERDALRRLVAPFCDPSVGGVCGFRRLAPNRPGLRSAQRRYISLDSRVKELESRRGSITSNDGKLYAVRRALFRPIPEGVTDDLYSALNVVSHGARFVFEPRAEAFIRVPSRTALHEVGRRRRIVARSLRGMWLMRRVFHPGRCGFFSVGLFVNKVMRRLLPVFLVVAMVCAILLARSSAIFQAFVVAALAFAVLGALGSLTLAQRLPRPIAAGAALAHYFLLGNWGTLLGLTDFLRNRTVVRWDPLKSDGGGSR